MSKYWISGSAKVVEPLLNRLGILYGQKVRVGEKTDLTVYHFCDVKDAIDLDEHWGNLSWGPEDEPCRPRVVLGKVGAAKLKSGERPRAARLKE